MFKKLKRKIRLKQLKRAIYCEIEKIRYCKSELYDIEHDLCLGKGWIIQKYGSMEAYKQSFEDWIGESYNKLKEYWTEESRLRDP